MVDTYHDTLRRFIGAERAIGRALAHLGKIRLAYEEGHPEFAKHVRHVGAAVYATYNLVGDLREHLKAI